MAVLIIDPAAEDELDRLYESDEDAAALIDALLEQLGDDEGTLGEIFRPGHFFRYRPPFEVKRFEEAQRRGKNILTMRVRDEAGTLLPYRVLFAHHAQIDSYYVLSVASREDAYDPSKPGFLDLLVRYDEHGIPTYKY